MGNPSRDIRFTATEDGVSIAFWEIGEGKPVLLVNNQALSHCELEWTVPSIASFLGSMAERYRLIRYDPRGMGLSGGPPGGWGTTDSSGAQVGVSTSEESLDLKAVCDAVSVESVALVVVNTMGPVGIEFAAEHSDVVSALILCDAVSDLGSSYEAELLKGYLGVLHVEAELGQSLAYSGYEREVPNHEIEAVTDLIKANTNRIIPTARHAMLDWNADRFLGEVKAPTLILCSRQNPIYATEMLTEARKLAGRIQGSQLRMVDGTRTPFFADQRQVLGAIDELLKPGRVHKRSPGFRTVVFTDIVDSTRFMSEVGDEKGREAMRAIEERVSNLAGRHSGLVIKNLGDGSLVSFSSNTAALRFALELQSQTDADSLQLRIGMAAGEPIEEGGDIHGAVVAYASRVADIGDAGEIVASDSVRQLAMGKGFTFTPMGQHDLKGFDEPATVWKVTPFEKG